MNFDEFNEPEQEQIEDELKPEKRSYRKLYFFLLIISLLLHLLILDVFFNFGLRKRGLSLLKQLASEEAKKCENKKTFVYFNPSKDIAPLKQMSTIPEPISTQVAPPLIEIKPEPDNGLPASLKPRKSEFGFPNANDEIPEEDVLETKLGTEDKAEELAIEAEANAVEEEAPKIKQAQKKLDSTAQPESKAEPTQTETAETADSKTTEKIINEAPEPVVNKTSAMFAAADKEARIKQIMAQQKILEQYQGQDFSAQATGAAESQPGKEQEKSSSYLSGDSQKISLRAKGKKTEGKKRNIIAMTKGFIENLKDEGNDWLERKGDDNKRPSFEELKYISYEEKITWGLQASWKQSFEHSPLHDLNHNDAVIDFSIDDQGNLVNCEMLQSTGNADLDRMIIKNTKLASPFPPLPKHFNTKLYRTGRIIHVYPRNLGF